MACLHPLRAFPTGALTDEGKPVYFVTSHRYSYATADDFIRRGLPYKDLYVDDFIEIPCGRCVACRKHAQQVWAFRCLAESQEHPYSYFLTLTYDEQHLPKDSKLVKRDLQLFNKRLRKVSNFRFFACGEYGEMSKRPHYHGLYFSDVDIFPDRRLWSRKGNYSLYNSAVLSKLWGKGFAVIGQLTPSSCAYCAKYCLKQDDGFILMSRRPGLGDKFFHDHLSDQRLVLPSGEGRSVFGGLPRYVKRNENIPSRAGDYVNLSEFAALSASGISDMDDFRDLEDYLLKHPARVSL